MHRETSAREDAPWWKRLLGRIRENRRLELMLYCAAAVIVVALYALGSVSQNRRQAALEPEAESTVSVSGGQGDTEERLRQVLSCIRGAGRVEVMITYATGGEVVTAMSTSVDTSGQESMSGSQQSTSTSTTEKSQPATVNNGGGEEPIVLMKRTPQVRGVIVVAEGAADIRVMLDLQRAVRAVLDIPVSCIEVFEYGRTDAAMSGG